MTVKIKKLSAVAILPKYVYPGDAGLDLYSQENYILKPDERHEFTLGFAMEIPEGFVGLVWDKSGLSYKNGLKSMGGVIDAGYRGECKVMLINLGDKPYTINSGDKIAQLLIQPVESVKIEEVNQLSNTSRGKGGFGSTGRK